MDSTVNVALVVPLHGSAGIFGPSCELCARLAVAEINAADGVLGRELRLSVIDGSGPPSAVADEVGALAAAGLVDAVVGYGDERSLDDQARLRPSSLCAASS